MLITAGWAYSLTEQELVVLRDGFEARRDAAFDALRDKPLVIAEKQPPLSPGRGTYSRHFAYSITDFAMKAFWLNEQIDTANEALQTYSKYYISDRHGRNDRDSFYWAVDVVSRIVEFYGRNGTIAKGRLTEQTEDLILEMMWQYAKECSKVDSLDKVYAVYAKWDWSTSGGEPIPVSAEVDRSKTWDVIESENHHAMKVSTVWHFSRLLSLSPKYDQLKYDDGFTAGEHLAAWTRYSKEYLRQRAKKGLCLEMADGTYNAHTLKGIYNYYDFSDDRELRALAGNLLTLYYASWAQEQIDGVRGGGKSRMNGEKGLRTITPITHNMWYYAGLGSPSTPTQEMFTVLTSGYRPPLVVIDLVLDVQGRGNYELHERPLGLADGGFYRNPHYKLRTDYGGIVRYSYCTPDFIMGMPVVEARPFTDWILISSQSRWLGVIFAGDLDARIYPQCKPDDGSVTFNQQWGVQKKGTMISQRLPKDMSQGAGDMQVWFSKDGLENRLEKSGWIFTEAKGAFAAVRPARGEYSWQPQQPKGQWLTFADISSPAIIEVAQKRDFKDYAAFQDAVLTLPVVWNGQVLNYTGLGGDKFTFYADYSDKPKINGKPFNYAPENVFESPFINSKWDSGVVTITKGDKKLVLDFVNAGSGLSDEEINALKDSFNSRSRSVLESQVTSPYPGSDSFVWNKQDFALAALMLNTKLEDANQAVIDACDHILNNEKCPSDCSLHWNVNLFFRMYEFFNSASSHYPSRLSPQAEQRIVDVMWFWLDGNSLVANTETQQSKSWYIWESENHDAMNKSSCWSAAMILSGLPEYADRELKDGKTVTEHFVAWNDFFKYYLRERAVKGGIIEAGSHSYSKYTLQGWYNFYDFAQDAALKKSAEYALDLWWSSWALEQIEGRNAGAKSRVYHEDIQLSHDGAYSMCWYYLGIGSPKSKHPGIMCLATSSYRLPDVVYDIASDIEGRGTYEFYTRRLGRNIGPVARTEDGNLQYKIDPDRGGLVKYTFVTPGFVMGSFLQEKLDNKTDFWSGISSQNRWIGIAFAGGPQAIVVPSCEALGAGGRTNHNQHISVQKNGTMIVRKMFEAGSVGNMRMYFGDDMDIKQINDGFIVAAAKGGYASVKPVWGTLNKIDKNWYQLSDSKSPIVIEAAAAGDHESMAAFTRIAGAAKPRVDKENDFVEYQSMDGKNTLVLYLDVNKLPRINGTEVDIYPDFAYKSPYLNSKWGDGIIVVKKGAREKVLDFNKM